MRRKKNFLIVLGISLVLFLLIPPNNIEAAAKTIPVSPSKEEITNFDVVQTFQLDGTILVEEKIAFYCGGGVIQNGLVRTFAKQMVDNEKKLSNLLVSAFALNLDGQKEKFSVQQDTSSIYVYMGDITKKLTKGPHLFVLNYQLNGVVNAYSYNYAKYFFFPLGSWDLPIERATITIKVPVGKNVTLLQPQMFKTAAATTETFPTTVFYISKASLRGELLLIPKDPIAGGDILALTIIMPKAFLPSGESKIFYFGYWGFYLFSASLLLFSLYVFFHKTPKPNTLPEDRKNKKWYFFSRAAILLADFLALFFIFNKANADLIFWLLTILLLLATEIILTTNYEGTNKNFIFFKYGLTTIATFFYCFALLNFIYKIQGLILLLIIISQILFLNRRKETS